MKRSTILMAVSGVVLLASSTDGFAQRRGGGGVRGGGGGGGRNFGGGGGGFTAPARPAQQFSRPAPQVIHQNFQSGARAISGTAGAAGQAGRGSGSFNTQPGGKVYYGRDTIGGMGKVGGGSITTPGGQTINHAGRGGAVVGAGGNPIGGRSIANTTGPHVAGAAASRRGVAVGPNGVPANRANAAVTTHGTYYRSASAISTQRSHIQDSFVQKYPALSTRWAGYTYRPITWSALASYGGYPVDTSTVYDYGSSVVYQDDAVYVNGDFAGTSSEYADQASAIANMGTQAPPAKEEEFTPLGVYAMVTGDEKTSYNIFQLSINKDGILKGSYYNALTDTTEPVIGAADKRTQRAAWTVGDKKAPTYEVGIVNLTEDETTMMVHYSKDRSQQMTLVRIKQDENAAPPAAAPPAKDGK